MERNYYDEPKCLSSLNPIYNLSYTFSNTGMLNLKLKFSNKKIASTWGREMAQ